MVDPPPPIETAGVSVISSLEFYQAAKARLNPGGVMMQWIPYGQTLDEFKDHVRTYASVFPHVIIVFGPGGNGLYMLGSNDPISFDPAVDRGGPRPARTSSPTSRRRPTRRPTTWPAGRPRSRR